MKPALLIIAFFIANVCLGQGPVIDYSLPMAVSPGATTRINFYGERLAAIQELWTSFPSKPEIGSTQDGNGASFLLEIPKSTQNGFAAVRLAGASGVSAVHLILLDDLTSVIEKGANNTLAAAQKVSLPTAVDGQYEPLVSDYYEFTGEKGQVITAEVVSYRLGYPLDAVLRLLDANGNELAYSEDGPGTGGDPFIRHRCMRSGKYYIEVRDTRFQGGKKHRYRLRIGQIEPMPNEWIVNNLSGQLCNSTPIEKSFKEQEPNDQQAAALKISLPGVITGKFDKDRDVDQFSFDGKKGLKVLITGKTRRIGSPCDLYMQLFKPEGASIAESNISGINDGSITNTLPADGSYRLVIEELNRQGGENFHYEVELKELQPGYSLAVEADTFNAVVNETIEVKVTCMRRDYTGPIALSVEGLGSEYQLDGNIIPKNASETKMRIALRNTWKSQRFAHFLITGQARVGNILVTELASSTAALKKTYPQMLYPPEALDGVLAIGLKEPGK